MTEMACGVHSSTNWVLQNFHHNSREDFSLHCFSSRLHIWTFSELVETQNTHRLVCLQPIKTSNRECCVPSHFVLLCCCFLNLKLFLLRLLSKKKRRKPLESMLVMTRCLIPRHAVSLLGALGVLLSIAISTASSCRHIAFSQGTFHAPQNNTELLKHLARVAREGPNPSKSI